MPETQLAQYGIAIFAVGGAYALLKAIVDAGVKIYERKNPQQTHTRCADNLSTVITNNTKAIAENTKSNQELQTIIKVFQAEQGSKMDEMLERARRAI
jgi:hypothetical protein